MTAEHTEDPFVCSKYPDDHRAIVGRDEDGLALQFCTECSAAGVRLSAILRDRTKKGKPGREGVTPSWENKPMTTTSDEHAKTRPMVAIAHSGAGRMAQGTIDRTPDEIKDQCICPEHGSQPWVLNTPDGYKCPLCGYFFAASDASVRANVPKLGLTTINELQREVVRSREIISQVTTTPEVLLANLVVHAGEMAESILRGDKDRLWRSAIHVATIALRVAEEKKE